MTPPPPRNPDPSASGAFTTESGDLFTYSGPPARGQGAPDGLFLYVLDPATFDSTQRIDIKARVGHKSVGFGGLIPRDSDVRQQSGCFLAG